MQNTMKMKLKKTMNLTKKDELDSSSRLKIPSGKISDFEAVVPTYTISDGEK